MMRSLGFLFRRLAAVIVTGCDDTLFSVFDWLRPPGANSVALVRRDDATRTWAIGAHALDRAVWDRSVIVNPDFGQLLPEGWGDGTDLGGGNGPDNTLKARLPLARVGTRVFAWTPGWDDLSYAEEHVNGAGIPSSFTWGRYLQSDCVNCRVSDDGGATWADFADLTGVRQIVGLGTFGYALHDDGLKLSRTTDGGVTWTIRHTQPTHTPPAFPGPGFVTYSNPATSARWWTLAIDPVDPRTITLVDKEGFWTSYDAGATLKGPMLPGGVKLHFEGDSAFAPYTSSPTYSDYWYDDFPCADVIRLAGGHGYAAYWAPSSTRYADNPTVGFHALVGTDNPAISAGGTIAVAQDFHPSGHPFQVDFTSRFWRGVGSALYLGTSSGQEASVYKSTDGGTTWAADIPVPSLALNRDAATTRRPGGTGGGTIKTTGDVLLAPGSFGFGPGWEGDDAGVSNGPRLWKHDGAAWSIDDDDTFVPATTAFDGGDRLYAAFNQGFLRTDCPTVPREYRRVGALLFPAYDAATGGQIVAGRRNDNSWIKRSDNPVDPSNSALLTYSFLTQKDSSFPVVFHHVLWAYPDWAAGEFGKSGLGNNLYASDDDGATWAAVTEFSDVVDYGPFTSLNYVLHGGGTILSYRPSGVYAIPTGGHDFTLGATMNRVAQVHQIALGGGTTRSYVVLLAADGIYLFTYDQTGAAFATVALDGPTAYPTADPIPWAQRFNRVSTGSGAALSAVFLVLQPVEYGGLYSIPLSGLTPAGGSWTLDLAAGTTPPLQTATFMAAGGTRSFRWFNHNASQVWTELNLAPNPASPSGTRGAFSGVEAIFGGTLPVVEAGFVPSAETIVLIDPAFPHVVIATIESVRTAYLVLGDLPGEGGSPSYTSQQLVAVVRHASATIEYIDESPLLIIGGAQHTLHARNSGGSVNPSVADPSWRDAIG